MYEQQHTCKTMLNDKLQTHIHQTRDILED
jgi:hypothetical protein